MIRQLQNQSVVEYGAEGWKERRSTGVSLGAIKGVEQQTTKLKHKKHQLVGLRDRFNGKPFHMYEV